MNLAHYEGATFMAFSPDGEFCYTGGDDCLARIWRTDKGDDYDPDVAVEAGEPLMTIAAAKHCWFTGSADSEVRQYARGSREFQALVTSSAGVTIRCIAVDPKGKRVAVSSAEMTVKVVDIEDTVKIMIITGHTDCVRKVTWHPSGTILTTSGADGRIIVWDVSGDEPKEIRVIQGVIPAIKNPKAVEFFHDCSAIWHPSGEYFVVASRSHDVVAISKDTWEKSFAFTDDSVNGMTTALSLSANGNYLATSSHNEVYVWSTQTRRLLFKFPEPTTAIVTQMAFSPTANYLAWVQWDGRFLRWSDPIPASSPDPVKTGSTSTNTRMIRRSGTPTLFDDDDAVTKPGAKDKSAEDDAAELYPFDNDDWIIDDVGGAMQDEPEAERPIGNGFVKEMVSVTKAQPPFQPGSTPMRDRKRYLCYNMIGVIEVTDQDTHHIVNVEFHDRSARKAYHFTDHHKYDLATLGERGALYACQPEGEHPAHVRYKPYGNWAAQGEWTYELDEGVKVLGIAAGGPPPTKSLRVLSDGDMQGNGNVVIATSENELTFLTGTGIERCSIGLDGDFVSMVAGPEWVFVVQRDGATTMDGSQNLSGTLYDFEELYVLQSRKLPIAKDCTLKWIGVSEEGAPALYDSTGVMYIMPRFRIPLRGVWVRILDTNKLERKKGKDESYWPVGLSGEQFMCLILKGRQDHPGFPRPLIQELPMRLPFRGKDPKDGPLEEHVARENMYLQLSRDALGEDLVTDAISKRELAVDKELIQLIQTACKGDKLPRALELTRMLHHMQSFDMAMKVAEFYHLVGLQEKMQALKDDREDEDRLVGARDQRRQWRQDYAAVPPPRLPPADVGPSRTRAFQDFGPPPAIHRPGLARATPSVARGPNDIDYDVEDRFTPPSDGKRKRDEEDDVLRDSQSPDGTKRRALKSLGTETSVGPFFDIITHLTEWLAETNPFAKKGNTNTDNRNPFARNAEHNQSLHKSESFFEKVDAAESSKTRGKHTILLPRKTAIYLTFNLHRPYNCPKERAAHKERHNTTDNSVRPAFRPCARSSKEESQKEG
ncbi:WD40 repeat-like protein [Dentipellis sp. KUC8613]|nr:WD40 repeat-like protein [Dentipellis sp. KUC8613]